MHGCTLYSHKRRFVSIYQICLESGHFARIWLYCSKFRPFANQTTKNLPTKWQNNQTIFEVSYSFFCIYIPVKHFNFLKRWCNDFTLYSEYKYESDSLVRNLSVVRFSASFLDNQCCQACMAMAYIQKAGRRNCRAVIQILLKFRKFVKNVFSNEAQHVEQRLA